MCVSCRFGFTLSPGDCFSTDPSTLLGEHCFVNFFWLGCEAPQARTLQGKNECTSTVACVGSDVYFLGVTRGGGQEQSRIFKSKCLYVSVCLVSPTVGLLGGGRTGNA